MKKIILTLLILVSSVFAVEKKETYLGFTPGMSLAEITKLVGEKNITKTDNENVYIITKKVSSSNPFDLCYVVISKKYGLGKITASTEIKTTNVYGDELKYDYKNMLELLAIKYGNPESFDFLREGSIWDEPQDFTKAMYKGERKLASFWSEDGALKDTTSKLRTIHLEAIAASESYYYITLTYDFENLYLLLEESKKDQQDNLDL